jgi:hypothetical protein
VTTVIGPLPPIVVFVRRLEGDFYLCSEVAEALGVSTATLRRLAGIDPEAFAPSSIGFGKMLVRLYAISEVECLHQHLEAKSIAAASGAPRRPGVGAYGQMPSVGTGVLAIAPRHTGAVVVANSPMLDNPLPPQRRTGPRPPSGKT